MKLLTAGLVLFTIALSACATQPVNDPQGKWRDQASVLDNSLFQ